MTTQHDYDIANGTGQAVRQDINSVLQAIVSNNSGTSEPATTFKYQWWADETTNTLKLRNSSNNAWITLRELDGTMLMEVGSASTPGLAFADDLNTGIFRPDADQIGFATGGAERFRIETGEVVVNEPSNDVDFRVESNGNPHMLFVDAGNDRIGINEQSPSASLHVNSSTTDVVADFESTDANAWIQIRDNSTTDTAVMIGAVGDDLRFRAGSNERARIDSSGRFLVGTSSARTNYNNSTTYGPILNLEGTSNSNRVLSFIHNDNSGGPFITLGSTGGSAAGSNTLVAAQSTLGFLSFQGADGTDLVEAAQIKAQVDGTPGANDMPGRLVFSTCADGASTPTEHLRIEATGDLIHKYSDSSTSTSSQVPPGLRINNTDNTSGRLAGIHFSHGGAGTANAGIFHVTTNTATGSTACLGDLAFYMKPGGSSTMSESMRLDSNGKLLIGSSTASALSDRLLQVGSTSRSASYISIVNSTSGTGGLLFADGTDSSDAGYRGQVAYQHSSDAMQFWTAGSERGRFNNTGDFLVGTTSHSPGLGNQNSGCQFSAAGFIAVSRSGGQPCYFNRRTSTGTIVGLSYNGTQRGSITTDGTVVAFNTSSDHRLKENIVDLNGAITRVKQLQPRRFNFIEAPSTTVDGFVAHEAQTVVPEAVTGTHNEVDEDDNPVYQGIDQSKLVPLLTAALQEAIAKIETLETKVAALEAG